MLDNLSKIQEKAVKYNEGPTLIFAGAGSGKTRVLTHKIAYIIANNIVRPENILAVTFTNKAAKELEKYNEEFSHFIKYVDDDGILKYCPAEKWFKIEEDGKHDVNSIKAFVEHCNGRLHRLQKPVSDSDRLCEMSHDLDKIRDYIETDNMIIDSFNSHDERRERRKDFFSYIKKHKKTSLQKRNSLREAINHLEGDQR